MSKINKSHKPHNHWTLEEDHDLKELVKIHGPRKWKEIAKRMKTERDAKQCRERYHGHLSPEILKKPLTKAEDDLVVRYRNIGHGWAEIARLINEEFHIIRTPNQLKNNFNQRLSKSHPDVKLPTKNNDIDNKHIEAYVAKSIKENEYRYNNIAEKSIEVNTNNTIAIESTKFNIVEKSNKTEIANFAATNTITKKRKFEAIDEKANELSKLEFDAISNKFEFGAFSAKTTETNKVEFGNLVAKSSKVEIANITTDESRKRKFEAITAKTNVEYSFELTIIASKPRKKRKSKMDIAFLID